MPAWDLQWLHIINSEWTHPVLDWLMPALSALSAWIPIFALLVLGIIWKGGAKGRFMLVCIAVAIMVGDGLVSNALKKSIGRVRPRDAIRGVVVRDLGKSKVDFLRLFQPPVVSPAKLKGRSKGSSFPSSHTINMFAVATVVALFYRGCGLIVYVLAVAVAYSRIYCGAHWPSDVIPSTAMGVLVGLFAVWLVRKIAKKASRAH